TQARGVPSRTSAPPPPPLRPQPPAQPAPTAEPVLVPVPVRPVANLSPTWKIDRDPDHPTEGWTLADAGAAYAIVDRLMAGGSEVAIVETGTGAILRRVNGWTAPQRMPYFDLRPRLVDPGTLLIFTAPETLAGVDPASGRMRWESSVHAGYA